MGAPLTRGKDLRVTGGGSPLQQGDRMQRYRNCQHHEILDNRRSIKVEGANTSYPWTLS